MGLTCKQPGKMRGIIKRVENERLKEKQAEKRAESKRKEEKDSN